MLVSCFLYSYILILGEWGLLGSFIYLLVYPLLRHYTVRYREKNKKWNYQTCPTSDTVIDNLKPNVVYEFGVKPTSKEGTGEWSKPVVHNTSNVGLTGISITHTHTSGLKNNVLVVLPVLNPKTDLVCCVTKVLPFHGKVILF